MWWQRMPYLLLVIALTMTPVFLPGCTENLPTEEENRPGEIEYEIPTPPPSAQSSPMTWPSSIWDFKFPFDGIWDACGGQVWKVVCGYGCGWHTHYSGYPAATYHSVDLIRQDAPTLHSAALASARGIVIFSGWMNGYGWCVAMDHHNGWRSLVGHLETNPREFVNVGNDLRQGTFLGYAGATGGDWPAHIHLSVWKNGSSHTLDGISWYSPIRVGSSYTSGNDYVTPPAGHPNPRP